MSTTAAYASTPFFGSASVTTGDTSRTAPSVANTGQVATARTNGARIDRLMNNGIGTTVASVLRLWAAQGFVGMTISSITFSGTTATVTTSTNHGLSTGNLVTVQGASPRDYNVNSASITVTGLTTFTYTMSTTPTTNASTVGDYSYTPSTPSFTLLGEIQVTANTPSSTNPVWNKNLCEATNPDVFPLILAPGYQLRTSVNDTQTASGIMSSAIGGQF